MEKERTANEVLKDIYKGLDRLDEISRKFNFPADQKIIVATGTA